MGFTPAEQPASACVSEPRTGGAAARTLGELMENENTLAVLKTFMGPMLDNPMIASMKDMSLKKLMSLGGQTLPPALLEALDSAWTGE